MNQVNNIIVKDPSDTKETVASVGDHLQNQNRPSNLLGR